MSGCSHSACHRLFAFICLAYDTRPKASPKGYGFFQLPGWCFQNPASMGWGYQFRVVVDCWWICFTWTIKTGPGFCLRTILMVEMETKVFNNERITIFHDFPNICPVMFGTCQTPGLHSSGSVDFLGLGDALTKIIIWVCQDLISEIPHVAKLWEPTWAATKHRDFIGTFSSSIRKCVKVCCGNCVFFDGHTSGRVIDNPRSAKLPSVGRLAPNLASVIVPCNHMWVM